VKRWLSFAAVFALGAAGLILSQTRKADAPAAPTALLYLVSDSERELTRLPMKYTEIPDKDEIKMGDEIARQLGESNESDEDRMIEGYVRTVGNRVAANAARKLPYRFHYIPGQYFVNAFALPGGHVYMGGGLLALMENEDELAAVLGHEIEHIDHRHCAERLQTEAALKKIPLGEALAIPVGIFQAGYNKDQEMEADREGTRLAVLSGYSAEGAVQVFTKFQEMEERLQGKRKATPEEEIEGTAVQILTGYFRSHPPSADRAGQIRRLIADEHWTAHAEKPLEVRYVFLGHKADDLVKAGQYDKAIQTANSALQLHASYPPALVALAQASCAKHDFVKAAAAYKELLDQRRPEADLVRKFADERAGAAKEAKHYEEAAKFAAFSLELQPSNPSAMKLLIEAKLELRDIDAALETGRRLQLLYPTDETELVRQVNDTSRQAFEARDYNRAALFAGYSTRLRAAFQPRIEVELARSEFLLGDFPAAAESYRKLIEHNVSDRSDVWDVRDYADSLGSYQKSDAARDFRTAVSGQRHLSADQSAQIKIEEAGLMVMAGDDSAAKAIVAGREPFAPELAARLGWWYYRAGKFNEADQVLQRYLAQRPGDGGLGRTLGWVLLEQNKTNEAKVRFDIDYRERDSGTTARAGQAISLWRLGQRDFAITQFELLSKEAPEWTNATWVSALYGPTAAKSMQEIAAEEQRRIEARKIPVRRK
jgi:predicted Zn-dependent protease